MTEQVWWFVIMTLSTSPQNVGRKANSCCCSKAKHAVCVALHCARSYSLLSKVNRLNPISRCIVGSLRCVITIFFTSYSSAHSPPRNNYFAPTWAGCQSTSRNGWAAAAWKHPFPSLSLFHPVCQVTKWVSGIITPSASLKHTYTHVHTTKPVTHISV